MPFMPILLIPMWLLGLLSLGLLGGGAYLFWQWYTGAVVGTSYLLTSVGMMALTVVGRPLALLLLGRADTEPPHPMRSNEMQRVKRADGTELHVEFFGPLDAPPIVLTHGWGVNSTEWYYTKRALAERFRVIVWDLPGLGKSGRRGDKDYRLENLAEDLRAVLGVTGSRPVILVGHSIGGMITETFWRLFGAEQREKVAGIVFVHTTYTNPVNTTTLSGLLRALQGPVLRPLLYGMILLAPLVWLMNWLAYFNGSQHLSTALSGFVAPTRGQLDFAARLGSHGWPGVLARGMLAMFGFDERATLPTITVPTLVVSGSRDPVLLPDASRFIHASVPGAQLIELDPAKHMGLMDQHQRFNAALLAFAEHVHSPG